jgi:antitoxin component YwqK of YwqJK toxin-antitoxin module
MNFNFHSITLQKKALIIMNMIYNELKWLRMIISIIPYIGTTLDMIFYKKGIETDKFTAGENLVEGDNCYLNVNDGKFYLTIAKSEKTASTMIVKSLQKIKKNRKGVFLIKGKFYTSNLTMGNLFLSKENGKLQSDTNFSNGMNVRKISVALSDKVEFFNPSSTCLTLA